MNDFLKNLRSGKDKHQGHRGSYDKHSYHYESQKQYYGNEKRAGTDRRKARPASDAAGEALADFFKVITPVLTEFLTGMLINQQQLLENEKKKAEAVAVIAEAIREKGLEGLAGSSGKTPKRLGPRKPIDQNRRNILQFIGKKRNEGQTFDQIAVLLENEQFETFSGRGKWHAQTVHRLYQDYLADLADESLD